MDKTLIVMVLVFFTGELSANSMVFADCGTHGVIYHVDILLSSYSPVFVPPQSGLDL